MSRPIATRPARAARHAARALAALVVAALVAPAARAQTTTLTFNGLTAVDASGVRFVDNCYEESGFRVAVVGFACGAPSTLGAWTPDFADRYTGSPALHNEMGSAVDFTAISGQAFSFQSIGLASFFGQFGDPTTVMFTGFLASGGMMTQTVEVPGGNFRSPAALSPFSFTGFTNLRSLRLTVVTAAPEISANVQFDNVAFGTAAVVPEPTTVVLIGAGLAGLGAVARRRRAS